MVDIFYYWINLLLTAMD